MIKFDIGDCFCALGIEILFIVKKTCFSLVPIFFCHYLIFREKSLKAISHNHIPYFLTSGIKEAAR